jgi:hypothetical protein
VALLALAVSTLVPAAIATIAAIAATTTVSIVGAGRESAIVEVLDERSHNVDMAEFGGSSFPHVDVLTEEHTEVVWWVETDLEELLAMVFDELWGEAVETMHGSVGEQCLEETLVVGVGIRNDSNEEPSQMWGNGRWQ